MLLTRGRAARGGWLVEILVLGALLVITIWAASVTQHVTVTRYWDGDEYYFMTEQLAAGQTPHVGAPYVYRLATPWLVARFWPDRIVTGFRTINIASTAATVLLLIVWLRRFVAERWARMVVVALFILEWHGPARFISYYPVYVDPLTFPCLLGGLILIDEIRSTAPDARGILVWSLTALCVVGILCREVMIVIPLAVLCVGDPFGAFGRMRASLRAFDPRLLIPFAASAAVIELTHLVTRPRVVFSFFGTAFLRLRAQPAHLWVLAWFITFGPVLILPFYDWRRAWRTLAEQQYLAGYLVTFAALSYIGGTDTERFIFWVMPVVYLLAAQALVAHQRTLNNTYLAAALIVAQAVSARVLSSIPSPSLEVASVSDMPSFGARVYSVLDRLFVIDDFHWNLWSNFGSRPFHALLLAIYLVFSISMIGWMHVRATRIDAF